MELFRINGYPPRFLSGISPPPPSRSLVVTSFSTDCDKKYYITNSNIAGKGNGGSPTPPLSGLTLFRRGATEPPMCSGAAEVPRAHGGGWLVSREVHIGNLPRWMAGSSRGGHRVAPEVIFSAECCGRRRNSPKCICRLKASASQFHLRIPYL